MKLCRLLIAAHANVNAVDLSGAVPFEHAASNAMGNTTILQLLLDSGAEIDHRNEGGRSALFSAASQGDLIAVQFLLDHGATTRTLDSQGRNLIHAVFPPGPAPTAFLDDGRDSTALLQLFLEAGVDINQKDRFGRTPLFGAITRAEFTNVQFLLQHGANPDVKDIEDRMAMSFLPKSLPAASIARFDDLFLRARQKRKG
jgi:ankyrin repeat protein